MTLPAGQSATADLKGALDNIFNHPNVGPFVCKQLIQRLVAGNPSPAYVERVAKVFADNGNGVRGDMKAVITAILLDPEARANDTLTGDQLATSPAVQSGHLREPALWAVETARGLNAAVANPTTGYPLINMGNGQLVAIGEPPFGAPSVLGFSLRVTRYRRPRYSLRSLGWRTPGRSFRSSIWRTTSCTTVRAG